MDKISILLRSSAFTDIKSNYLKLRFVDRYRWLKTAFEKDSKVFFPRDSLLMLYQKTWDLGDDEFAIKYDLGILMFQGWLQKKIFYIEAREKIIEYIRSILDWNLAYISIDRLLRMKTLFFADLNTVHKSVAYIKSAIVMFSGSRSKIHILACINKHNSSYNADFLLGYDFSSLCYVPDEDQTTQRATIKLLSHMVTEVWTLCCMLQLTPKFCIMTIKCKNKDYKDLTKYIKTNGIPMINARPYTLNFPIALLTDHDSLEGMRYCNKYYIAVKLAVQYYNKGPMEFVNYVRNIWNKYANINVIGFDDYEHSIIRYLLPREKYSYVAKNLGVEYFQLDEWLKS